MSKRSGLLCLVCVLLVALLAGDLHQLVSAAAGVGDEFLSQDPILMLSHAGRDELNGASSATPAFIREQEEVPVLNEDAFLSSSDRYAGKDDEGEEALLFVCDESAVNLDRSPDGEEVADKEEGEENSLLLSGQGAAIAEGSNGSSEEHGSGGYVECPECGKYFRNHKSMFGHLRSHPNRRYKGATPPSAKPKLLPPAVEDDHPVTRHSQSDPNLNTFEILAAYVMLTLKHHDSRIARDQSVKREQDAPGEEDSVMTKEDHSVAQGNKHGSSAAAMAGDDTVRHSEHGSSIAEMEGRDDHQGSSIIMEAPIKKARTKKSKEGSEAHRKEKRVPSAAKARRPYICKYCKAEFPTHQALGGHMAAHNKGKRVQAQNEQVAAAALEAHRRGQGGAVGKEEEQRRRDGLSASTNKLLLERYTRLFNQGRQPRQEEAAGGYKRKHTEKEHSGGGAPIAPPMGDGDRRRLLAVDISVQAPQQE